MNKFTWNVRGVMHERRMSIESLGQALLRYGARRSRSSLYALVGAAPRQIDLDLLVALCYALRCTADELIVIDCPGLLPPPFRLPTMQS